MTVENFRQFRLLTWISFIGQFVHSLGWEGMGERGWIVILASYKFYFIRMHNNLVRYPSNNKSIAAMEASRQEFNT